MFGNLLFTKGQIMKLFSTRQVAKLLGVTPASLAKAIWDGRVDAPAKGPSGNFLWTINDIERASWAMCRRAFEATPELLAMAANNKIIA